MSLSNMFNHVKKAVYYVKIPQLLKNVKITDVPYGAIRSAVSRTLTITKELANQCIKNTAISDSSKSYVDKSFPCEDIEWDRYILDTEDVKHEQFLLLVASYPLTDFDYMQIKLTKTTK